MSLGTKKVVQIGHNFRNRRGMHHHLLVLLHLETELSIIVKVPEISLYIFRVVWRKEVVSLLPAPSVLGITLAYVVKTIPIVQVQSDWAFHEIMSK